MKDLTVYYAPSCAFSAGTVSFLLLRGADAHLVNLDEHPQARSRLEKKLSGRKLETPLLEQGETLHVAPSLSDLKGMLESWGLSPQIAPHAKVRE